MPVDAGDAWRTAMPCALNIGLMVGPSSGAAIHAALQVARELETGVVVALAPTALRNTSVRFQPKVAKRAKRP
jgi:cysteine synthase